MKTAELKSKIITQLRFHRVSGKHEDLTADHIIEIMQSNLWTSPCTCPPDEKTGETLCCNICGKPTARTSEELLGDDDAGVIAVNVASNVIPKLTTQEEAFFIAGFQECVKYLRTSPLLASKDARIRELEDNVKYWVEAWNRLSKMFSDQNEILTTLTPPKN